MSETRKALQDVADLLREAGWDRPGAREAKNGGSASPDLIRHVLKIHFAEIEEARASQYAPELRRFILDAAPEVTVSQEREDPEAQDAGGALAVILGSSAVVALARGIKAWLELRTRSSVVFKARGKELVINNLTCHQAADLAEKIAGLLGVTPSAKG